MNVPYIVRNVRIVHMEGSGAMIPHTRIVTRTTTQRIALFVVTSGACAIGVLSSASPAVGAAAASSTVHRTVQSLQSQGYTVIVNKTGSAALDDCTVGAVREGQT